jgi:hypothetical protein
MRHLAADELIDIAEGASGEASAPHLASCERCRAQLSDLRAMISAAASIDVPEPSPLFWDHLSERVRDAVSDDAARDRSWRLPQWAWRRTTIEPVSIAGLIVLAIIATMRLFGPSTAPTARPSPAPGSAAIEPLGASDDPSLTLIADLTVGVDWDELSQQVPLTTHVGGIDEAVSGLTHGELQELERLLKEEMTRSGARGA